MRIREREILAVFYDSSNRPKITPRHESAIMVIMEKNFTPREVQNSLRKLEEDRILDSIKYKIKKVGTPKFYFLHEFNREKSKKKIQKKIENYSEWIKKYSSKKITKILGDHL